MPPPEIRIIGLEGIPLVAAGDDLARAVIAAMQSANLEPAPLDVFVVAQKIVSKSEGRIVRLDSIEPSVLAVQWASDYGKDARVVEVVLSESKRIVRMDRGVLISETHHGFVCANAGVDASNIEDGWVALLPKDPDASAEALRTALEKAFGRPLGVVISDSFGRPWREGLTNVALGVAGFNPILDLRGQSDMFGQPLRVTTVALADEVASAAELVMAKAGGVPVAIVRGLKFEPAHSSGKGLIRLPEMDLFR
jgi:coenzyme F420-0:L-glutamate ligase/coenzyme F420-1:gamma-L-glutamate ligase